MKKALSIMFALLLLFLLPACGGEEDDYDGDTPSGGDGGNNEENGGWESQDGQDYEILKTRGFTSIYSLAVSPDDTLYIGGTTKENLYSDGLTETKEADALLVAFDTKGKELWGKQWDVYKDYDAIEYITIDNNGYIYISGGSHVTFVMKFAPDGAKIWEQFPEFGGITSLVLDSHQNVYISNYDESEIIKYSTDGKALQSYKILDEPLKPKIVSLAVDSEGNIYVVGQTSESLFAENAGKIDAFLVKLAPDGTQLWGKQWGSNENDYIYSSIIDDENNLYVVGNTLFKFSPDGEITWQQTKKYTSITIDKDRYIYVATKENGGNIDKYDSNGMHIGSFFMNYSRVMQIVCGNKGTIYVSSINQKNKQNIIKISSSAIN